MVRKFRKKDHRQIKLVKMHYTVIQKKYMLFVNYLRRISMSKKYSVQSIFITACICFLIIFPSACQSKKEEIPIQLKVIGEDYSPMQGLELIKRGFTEETGIEVVISKFDAENVRKKSIGDFLAGAGNYDVIMGAFYDVGLFAANKWVLKLDELLLKEDWKDNMMDMDNFSKSILDLSCRYNGNLFALPCSAQCMYLWFRKDLFNSETERAMFKKVYGYDLPSPEPEYSMTWHQYKDVAEFFTRTKGSIAAGQILEENLYGTVLQAKNHIALWFEFMNFLHSFGGRFINEEGNIEENRRPALEALKFYLDLLKYAPPGSVNYTWDEALTTFQNGQVAMAIMWSDSIAAVEDPSSSRISESVGYASNPVFEKNGKPTFAFGGWGFFINAKSKHTNEAFKFIQWCNRPSVQLEWALKGGIPATLSTYSSPAYKSIPGVSAHLYALNHLVGWSTESFSARMIEVGQNILARAVAKDIDAEEAIEQIYNRYIQIIEDTK